MPCCLAVKHCDECSAVIYCNGFCGHNGTCTHHRYEYDGDRLMRYDDKPCMYDTNGNILTYCGRTTTFDTMGRLQKYGETRIVYNGDGTRESKEYLTFTYDSAGRLIKQSDGLEFIYDNSGVLGLIYGGNTYFYRRDVQGNIIALIDNTGDVVVEYKYDAWGNHEAIVADETYVALAEINPFRYRGYYYDSETGLYYLQTRYYDPEVGRFISRDSIEYADPETICGLNLYAYCGNNPVMNVDPMGNAWWDWLLSIGQIIVGGILIITGVGAGFGAAMVAGGAIGLVSNIVGSTIGGGIGSMLNGYGAISTGLSMFSFGVPGIIAGVGLIAIGGATMAMGANEVVSGITGTNYLRDLMGEELYDGLYIGLNVASSIGTIAGRLGMRAVGTKIIGSHDKLKISGQRPYAKIIRGKTITYFDGKGNAYWSIHNAVHGGRVGNPHWHTEIGGHGPEQTYIGMLLRLIIKSLLG